MTNVEAIECAKFVRERAERILGTDGATYREADRLVKYLEAHHQQLASAPSEAELDRLRTLLRQAAVATGEQLGDWDDLPTVIERLKASQSAPAAMGLQIDVFDDGGDVELWLDPQGGPQVGVCIGTGESVKAAAEDAIGECQAAIAELQRVRDGGSTSNERTLIDAAWDKHKAAKPTDPIAAAVDAQLDPLKDELIAMGHTLAKETK
jgi:hypothetical protein